ncbi:ABC transporter permease [Streptomyces sp. NPDC056361]|uniref:ABC transporter permease n=1 Tax=Streptomyces sp. NPDC056361 TaxID=3345795 RepID=UPI0035D65CF0
MKHTLHAEWTKLRAGSGALPLLLLALLLTVATGAATAATVTCPAPGCGEDPVRLSLTGIVVGQAVVAIAAVLTVTTEYSTGLIHTTLTAVPRRLTAFTAKATAVTAAVLTTGTLAVLATLLAGRSILPGNGFTPENGFGPLSLADEPTLRAAAGSVLYLALIALLSLGVATAVREGATAIGIVLALLYLFPVVAQVVNDPDLQRHLQQLSPMSAGLAVQSTTDLDHLPIGPWHGLGVLAAWSATALLAGGFLLCRRDA